jgi:hypothetical protein
VVPGTVAVEVMTELVVFDEVLVSLAVPTEVLYEVAVELSNMSKEVIKGKGMLV